MDQSTIEKIKSILSDKIAPLGYYIYDIKYLKEGKSNILRVVIDKDGDISLDEIVMISDLISPILDVEDIISSAYTLDVCSLGAEKPIDVNKLNKYIGKYVNIHLSNPYKGLNTLEGELTSIDEEEAIITYKEKTRIIRASVKANTIDKARLAIKF